MSLDFVNPPKGIPRDFAMNCSSVIVMVAAAALCDLRVRRRVVRFLGGIYYTEKMIFECSAS